MIGGDKDLAAQARGELERLFDGADGVEGAQAWAGGVLEREDIDPAAAPLRALRALRREDSRLGRVAARYLVETLAGRGSQTGPGPRPRRRPRRPLLS